MKMGSVLDVLMLIVLIIYAFFTYLIANERYNPIVSTNLCKDNKEEGKINFSVRNHSKVEIKIFGKIEAKVGNFIFGCSNGFYGNEKFLILQPFIFRYGNFKLNQLKNKKGENLKDYIHLHEIDMVKFRFSIKYRRLRGFFPKKPIATKYIYKPKTDEFWLDEP